MNQKKFKHPYMNTSLAGICLLLAGSSLLYSCGGGDKKSQQPGGAQANGPVPVNTFTVHPQSAEYHDEYPGNIVALSQVDLHAQVEGYITAILFKEGDHVRKGQKLYEIDKSKYQASYDQATAGVRVAKANQDQAQKDADRYTYLNQHDAVAKQILDHAMTTLQNAKNQVTSAQQDLVKARTDLRFAEIVAPFDGTIGLSQVKLGTLVNPGQTVLNTISSDDPMAVDFVVNEKQIPRFIKLQKSGSNPADSIFTILMPDRSAYPYPGQISVIDRGVDPQTGTVKVRLVFPNRDNTLRAGMSCNVRVRNEDKSEKLIIPNKAIVEQMGEYFVFVTKDTVINQKDAKADKAASGPQLKAVQKKVILGQTIGANVIVETGLNDGDNVITDGIQKLRDGALVKTGGAPAGSQQPAASGTH